MPENRIFSYCLFFTFLVIGGIYFSPAFALEKITNFDAVIKMRSNSEIEVSERIEYDFGTDKRHGIFREIPIRYQARGGNYRLRLSNISVADESGIPYQFEISSSRGKKKIKIGDADALVSGKKTYVISYTVGRAINYFDTYDELYWNITGNDWQVVIDRASAVVMFPKNINSGELRTDCFSGILGSTARCASKGTVLPSKDGAEGLFFSQTVLDVKEGMTVVIGVPKGIMQKPSLLKEFLMTLQDNWAMGIPFIVLGVLSYFWYAKGRDPRGRGAIIAQFDAPDNLTPAEVGTILDEHAQTKDISAQIIDLAVRGYLKISRIEEKGILWNSTDYLLEKLQNEETLGNEFEKRLMENLFAGNLEKISAIDIKDETGKMMVRGGIATSFNRLSDLKETFPKGVRGIMDKMYESTVYKGYFPESPGKIRKIYSTIGGLLIMGMLFFGRTFVGEITAWSIIVSGALIVLFGLIMPAKTRKGVLAREHILGLKEYLKVAEKDRIKFHNAPEKNPERFEKLLPYAMVLGVEEEWAAQFEDVYKENPNWYHDSRSSRFNALALTHGLSDFSSAANSAFSYQKGAAGGKSGFGGGGFSGGGFGGGGGGSW